MFLLGAKHRLLLFIQLRLYVYFPLIPFGLILEFGWWEEGALAAGAGDVWLLFGHAAVGWTDDFVVFRKFFEAMSAPTADTGNGKERRVELFWNVEHIVNKAAVKIDVGTNAFVDFFAFADEVAGQAFHSEVEVTFVLAALFDGKLTHKFAQHCGARVTHRINGVAHAIDETRLVEALFVEEGAEVALELFFIGPILHMGLEVFKHMAHFDVGPAVLWPLEGAEGSSNGRIGVGAGRGDHAGGKGRVVATAVVGVNNQAEVEHTRLKLCIGAVGTNHIKDGFGMGKTVWWIVEHQGIAVVIMVVHTVAIGGNHREAGNELQALTHHIGEGGIVGMVIVGVEGEHRAREAIHHVVGWGLHNNIAHKAVWERAVIIELLREETQAAGARQLASEEEVGDFLKTVAFFLNNAAHQILHIVAAVVEMALARHTLAINRFVSLYVGHLGDASHNTMAIDVAQTALDIVFFIKLRVNGRITL